MRKYLTLLAVALIGLCGLVFFFFYRMGRNDAKALADFSVAYDKYDQSVSNYSKTVLAPNPESVQPTDDLERQADEALVALNTTASVRISSLTKNDGDLMKVSLEIANLAGKELDTLKAYQRAVADRSTESDKLAREFADLTSQRQAAYSRYRELANQ